MAHMAHHRGDIDIHHTIAYHTPYQQTSATMSGRRRIGVLTVCSIAAILCCAVLVTGLANPHHRRTPSSTATTSSSDVVSRRNFGGLAVSTTAVTAACLSSVLIISPNSALADPYNAFLPIGGGGIVPKSATIQRADRWEPPTLFTQLGIDRIGDQNLSSLSLSPLQQSLSPFAAQDIYYPSYFAGEWKVQSKLVSKIFPYGTDFVPSRSLIEGSPRNREEQVGGESTSYSVRYFSSIYDNSNNNNKNNKIISDRKFNMVSISRGYQQLSPVIGDSIEWNYKKDPTHLKFQTESVSADMRPIGQRRGEIYITARRTEEVQQKESDNNNNNSGGVFAAAERSRTITIGTGNVSANDQEVVTEYRQINNNLINAISRVAVYLTPNPNSREGVLWQQINGKAVAFYDYELTMERVTN